MSRIHVAVSATIDAAPALLYDIVADYRHSHPHILPQAYFTGLEVEEGGYGAGTIVRVHMRVLGAEQKFRMRISEPEPGRVLAETDMASGMVTTFTIQPTANQQQAVVTIATTSETQGGVRGLMERLFNPPLMRRIYRQELRNLAEYARRQGNHAPARRHKAE
jgi:hypothetical protein